MELFYTLTILSSLFAVTVSQPKLQLPSVNLNYPVNLEPIKLIPVTRKPLTLRPFTWKPFTVKPFTWQPRPKPFPFPGPLCLSCPKPFKAKVNMGDVVKRLSRGYNRGLLRRQ